MLPAYNLKQLANIKKEISVTDDEFNNFIYSSVSTNQSNCSINIKSEETNAQLLDHSSNEKFSDSIKNVHGINFDQSSTSNIKHEVVDIKPETIYTSAITLTTSDFETSFISVKDESYDNLSSSKDNTLQAYSTESQTSHDSISSTDPSSEGKLKHHGKKVHAKIKKHICHSCDKKFFFESDLKKHICKVRYQKSEITNGDIKCDQCGKSYTTIYSLKRHRNQVHLKIGECEVDLKNVDSKCDQCGKSYNSIYSLKRHQNQVHLRMGTNYSINIKSEETNAQLLNNSSDEIFSDRSSSKNIHEINLNQPSMPIIKHKAVDIQPETSVTSDITSATPDLETNFISVKDEYYDDSSDSEDNTFEAHSTESQTSDHSISSTDSLSEGTSKRYCKKVDNGDLKCDECEKSYNSIYSLKRHQNQVHLRMEKCTADLKKNGGSKCDQCGKSYSNIYTLERHKYHVHLKMGKFSCTQCEKSFGMKFDLRLHERKIHLNIKDWKCVQCEKSFFFRRHLKRHERAVHLKIRDWKCEQCEKFFSTKIILKNHERQVHLKIRNYKCAHCEKSFYNKRILKNHLSSVHFKLKNWKCTQCEKSFTSKYVLKQHKCTTYLNITDWKCVQCGKFFSSKSSLKKHEGRVHLKIKNWKCVQCDKTFFAKHNLEEHERGIHLKIRDLECSMCDKMFTHKSTLKRHEQTVHLDPLKLTDER